MKVFLTISIQKQPYTFIVKLSKIEKRLASMALKFDFTMHCEYSDHCKNLILQGSIIFFSNKVRLLLICTKGPFIIPGDNQRINNVVI